jgi:hypothetical protein
VPPRGDANVGLWQPRTITLPAHRIALLAMSAGPDLLVTAGCGGSVKLAPEAALRALAAEAGVRLPTRAAAVTEALAALLLGASSSSVAATAGQKLTAAATAAAAAAVAVLGGGGGAGGGGPAAGAAPAGGRWSGDSGSSGAGPGGGGAGGGGLLDAYGQKINDSAASIGELRRALIGAESMSAAAAAAGGGGGGAAPGGAAGRSSFELSGSGRSRAGALASGGSAAGLVAGRPSGGDAWPSQQRLEPGSPWIIEFGDLKLGRVVGEGSYGHVRIGWWHEAEVAVKVGGTMPLGLVGSFRFGFEAAEPPAPPARPLFTPRPAPAPAPAPRASRSSTAPTASPAAASPATAPTRAPPATTRTARGGTSRASRRCPRRPISWVGAGGRGEGVLIHR